MEGMNNNNNVDNQEKVQDNSTRFFTEEQFVAYKKERRRLKSERGIHRQVYAAFVSLIVAVTPVFYFFYYTGIFFLSLLAFRRIGGLLDRFTNFNSLFTNLFFWGGVLLYMGVLSIFCIIIIRKTLKDFEEDFTEEFFKNKALEAIAIQKNSVIYRYVSYIFYIIEGQDFAVNNIRFGRLYLGYYMEIGRAHV